MPASDRKQLLDEYVFQLSDFSMRFFFFFSSNSDMHEETKLVLTPEMIRAEFLDAHIDTSGITTKQE
jgi:hypothetical protein